MIAMFFDCEQLLQELMRKEMLIPDVWKVSLAAVGNFITLLSNKWSSISVEIAQNDLS